MDTPTNNALPVIAKIGEKMKFICSTIEMQYGMHFGLITRPEDYKTLVAANERNSGKQQAM